MLTSFKNLCVKNCDEPTKQYSQQKFHQEKSLKELILNKPKYNLIQKLQHQLHAIHGLKIIDKSLFYLACYISHYQALHQIISSGIKDLSSSFDKFKTETSDSRVKTEKPAYLQRTERQSCKSSDAKIILESYRYKCLQEFFRIEMYSEGNIINTIVNRIQEKVTKEEIKTVDHMISMRRISIANHRRQPNDQRQKENKRNPGMKHQIILPSINLPRINEIEASPKKRNKTTKKRINYNLDMQMYDKHDKYKLSPIPTLKSFKCQSRRNGIHEVNRILMDIEQLKEALGNQNSYGDEVMKVASSIKVRLNALLGNLKVKNSPKEAKSKDMNLKKMR